MGASSQRLAVVFGDAEAEIVAHLKSAFADRQEDYVPERISTKFPPEPLADGQTWVQVDAEPADISDYPVVEYVPVRVVCHAPHNQRSDVKALAALAQGLVCVHPGNDRVAAVHPRGGRSDVSVDPDTQNLMVWFLVRVSLTATPL